MRKVWIEVALNGAWSRRLQPGIPDTVDADRRRGHRLRARRRLDRSHACLREDGKQTFDWQVYARIIEGIRAAVDVPVYPSYPTVEETGSMAMQPHASPISRRWPTAACSTSP